MTVLVFEATHGAEDPERANLPFIRGTVAAASGQDVVVYLSATAVWLVTSDGGRDVRYGGHPAVSEMAAALVAAGGRVWVAEASAASRSLTAADFIEGAEIVPVGRFAELLAAGSTTFRG